MVSGLRRSLHFVPGIDEHKFNKALGLPADALILDLEDSVAPGAKAEARDQVCNWLREADFGDREKLVRINDLGSPWGREDLDAVMQSPPDVIVVPKVLNPGDVDAVDRLLIAREREQQLPAGSTSLLLLGTEAPAAVFNLAQMLANPRVQAVAWGAEDLAAALGAREKRDSTGNYLEVFQVVRSLCLLAASAAAIQPVDGPYVYHRDLDGLRRECRLTASMGFTGKLTIHPGQVEIVNDAFMPSVEEVRRAEELLAVCKPEEGDNTMGADGLAVTSAGGRNPGAVAYSFRGEMVDRPHIEQARRIVEKARLLRKKGYDL